MEYSKIKMELLKSGLPLESMIAESLNSLSPGLPQPLINHGEYYFQRQAEFPNSVDFTVTFDLDIENCDFVQIAFLIECKYRTRGTGWYFMPEASKDSGMEFFVQNFFSKGKCSWEAFPSLAPPLNNKAIPIAGKGIEVYSDGKRNEKSISEAIHQLMFGSASLMSRAFMKEDRLTEMMDERGINIRGRSFHSLLCSVIVTTSAIYFLKDIDIEKTEKSEKPEDIGEPADILLCSVKPPPYVQRYIREDAAKDAISLYPLEISTRDSIDFLAKCALFNPSRYYIVDYEKINDFLKEYIDFATDMVRFACKSKD